MKICCIDRLSVGLSEKYEYINNNNGDLQIPISKYDNNCNGVFVNEENK